LNAIHQELGSLPGAVQAGLRLRFANYALAITALGALPAMLDTIAAHWKEPRKRRPSLRDEAEAIGILVDGVESYTGKPLGSPRGIKQQPEFEFVRLLASRLLLPALTKKQFKTALGHWYNDRYASRSAKNSPQK
jgi:hypothetical protein